MPESTLILVHVAIFTLMGVVAVMILVVSSVHGYLQTRLPAGRKPGRLLTAGLPAAERISDDGMMPGRTEFLRQRLSEFLEQVRM